MIRLVDRTHVPASPEAVWAWFGTIDRHYQEWHPEHIAWRNIRGTPVTQGSIVFFDEWIGRFRLAMRCRIAEARPGGYFRYEGLFPYSLVRACGSFSLEPVNEECTVGAEVHIGWSVPVLGALLDWVIAGVFPLRELRRHMAEEGRNLTRLLAAGDSSPGESKPL